MWAKVLQYLGVYLIERTIKGAKSWLDNYLKERQQKKQDEIDVKEIRNVDDAIERARRMQAKIESIRNR